MWRCSSEWHKHLWVPRSLVWSKGQTGRNTRCVPTPILHSAPPADGSWRECSLSYSCHGVLVPTDPVPAPRDQTSHFTKCGLSVSSPRPTPPCKAPLQPPRSPASFRVGVQSVRGSEHYSCLMRLTLRLPRHQPRAPSSHLKSSRTMVHRSTQV